MLKVTVFMLMLYCNLSLSVIEHSWLQRIKASDIRFIGKTLCLRVKSSGTKADYRQRLNEIKRQISQDPLPVLVHNIGLKKRIKQANKSYKSLKGFLEHIYVVSKFPEISFLSECVKDICGLKRTHNPKDARTVFEKEFITHVNLAIIIYASLASGTLFPDLRILLGLLERGKKIKAIHLVDIEYKCFFSSLYNYYLKIALQQNKDINIIDMYDSNKLLNLSPADIIHFLDAVERDSIFNYKGLDIVPFIQFITFLTDIAGYNIDLYVHPSTEQYKRFLAGHKHLRANCGTIVDFRGSGEWDKNKQKSLYQFIQFGIRPDGIVGWLSDVEPRKKIDTQFNMLKFLKDKKVLQDPAAYREIIFTF